MTKASRSWKWLLAGALLTAVFCFLPRTTIGAEDAKEVISVERDKDKTSYVIRSNNDGDVEDQTDKAWEMLDNVYIDTRGRDGEGADNHR